MTDPTYDAPTYGDDLWDVARQLFDAGYPAKMICEDLGLASATFWRRARAEHWLRRDRRVAPPEPLDMAAPLQDGDAAADIAWRRMTQALEAGRPTDAMRWRRLHADLSSIDRRAAREAELHALRKTDALNVKAKAIEDTALAILALDRMMPEEGPP
jgi:hypothetical protein